MKIILLVCIASILLYVAYELIRIQGLIKAGQEMAKKSRTFEREEGRLSMLVLGDSTAVGVGADDPSHSVAGRLALFLDAFVENYAENGATTFDIDAQLQRTSRDKYDLILLQIGANDIIRFHSKQEVNNQLNGALEKLSQKSDRVVLLTAGKVGEAPFFPQSVGWLWTARAAGIRELFIATAEKHGVAYVDLFNAADPFSVDPGRYYAKDTLHPSSDGYGFWFDEAVKKMRSIWPELLRT